MGRRDRSMRAAPPVRLEVSRYHQRGFSLWLAILIACLSGSPAWVGAEPIQKASTARADRDQAAREIPYHKLTPEAQQKIRSVIERPSMFRRMPVNVVQCDPQIYRFLVRYPEVVVNIWQLMGITRVDADRVGPFALEASDGAGTETTIELVYGDQNTHVMFCEGQYDGPLFRKPLTGRCVLLLKSDYDQAATEEWNITNRMDVFLQVDNVAVDVLTKTLHPLLGRSADLNFVQSTQFLERISRTTEENGPGMLRLTERLDNVTPEVRQQFAELTQEVHRMAIQRGATRTARQDSTPTTEQLARPQ